MIVTPSQLTKRAELYHQLGSTISAGVPLLSALEMVSKAPGIGVPRRTVLELIQQIHAGHTFSESLLRSEGWIPAFDIALISAGEQAGRLDGSFKLLATYYSTRARLLRDMIAKMMVTAATFHVFLLIFPLSYLIEFAQGIFNGRYSMCVPFLIEKAIVFGSLYGFIFFLLYAGQGQRSETWRIVIESFTHMVPILRTGLRYLALARLSAALEALIASGVSIINSWELAAAASGSPLLHRQIVTWKRPMENGVTPSELVSKSSFFPEMYANLYHTGEESGQLDDTLHRLQLYYQEEGFRVLQMFTRILNAVLYGMVVLLVAYNVIRFWVNYYGGILNAY